MHLMPHFHTIRKKKKSELRVLHIAGINETHILKNIVFGVAQTSPRWSCMHPPRPRADFSESNVINCQLSVCAHVCVCLRVCVVCVDQKGKDAGVWVWMRQTQIDVSQIKSKGGLCRLLIAQTDDLS